MVWPLLVCLSLTATTLLVFWPVGDHGFVWYDDQNYIFRNPHVSQGLTARGIAWAFTSGAHANWHPLTWLSHMLDVELFGLERPGLHHLVNVGLHCANAMLLFLILLRMTGALWRCAFVAAVFALHPLHVESVAWAAERKDTLSTLFGFACIGLWSEYARRGGWRWYGASCAALALGLMAKPMLVTLPFLLLVLDYWPLQRLEGSWRGLRARLIEKLPMLLLVAASSAVTFIVQDAGGAVRTQVLDHGLSTAVTAYVRYIGQTLAPLHLAVFYPNWPGQWAWWQLAGAGALLVANTGAVLALRRRFLVSGWLWYLGTLVPVIGIVQVGSHSMADRYMYLPQTGLVLMVAWGVPALVGQRRRARLALATAATAVLVACAWLTRQQVHVWRDSITLFSHALERAERKSELHDFLGFALFDAGRLDEAIGYFRRSLAEEPDAVKTLLHLGAALRAKGDFDAAIVPLETALRLAPTAGLRIEAQTELGCALQAAGQTTRALPHLQQAVQADPDNAAAHNNLAVALVEQRQFEQAEHHLRTAIALLPDYALAHYNLGDLLRRRGDTEAAAASLRRALALRPDYVEATIGLAETWLRAGRYAEAVPAFRDLVRLHPSFGAHAGLGRALLRSGDPTAAIDHLRQAMRLRTDKADACADLAWILATHPDPARRDAAQALQIGQRAVELTGNADPAALDSLAAAYANAGRFDEAISTAQRAAALAKEKNADEFARQIGARLTLYQQGQPYRDAR